MAFHDTALFPPEMAYGTSGGPSHDTLIQELPSGVAYRVARRDEPLMRYRVNMQYLGADTAGELLTFIRARRGSLYGFRILDFADFSASPGHVSQVSASDTDHRHTLGTGNGTQTQFQLVKVYEDDASYTASRTILKPLRLTEAVQFTGRFLEDLTTGEAQYIWVDSVAKTEGTHYSIDYATGIVTFGTAPAIGEVVEWAGYFVVPARFDVKVDDMLSMTVSDYETRDYDVVDIVEDPQDYAVLTLENHPRGARYLDATGLSSVSLSIPDGFLQIIDPDAATAVPLPLYLPSAHYTMAGGPLFRITNAGAVDSITIYNNVPAIIGTLTPGDTVEVYLGYASGGAATNWVLT